VIPTGACTNHEGHVTLPLPLEGESPDDLGRRLELLWTLDEVRQGRMTRLRAASIVGLSLDKFSSQASSHGLDAIDYDLEGQAVRLPEEFWFEGEAVRVRRLGQAWCWRH
jgi:hypothetical protein